MRSADGSSTRNRVVLDTDWRDFSTDTNGLQMTALSLFNFKTNLDRIYETRGLTTIEASNLPLSDRILDLETRTHQSLDSVHLNLIVMVKLKILPRFAKEFVQFFVATNAWKYAINTRSIQIYSCCNTTTQ